MENIQRQREAEQTMTLDKKQLQRDMLEFESELTK